MNLRMKASNCVTNLKGTDRDEAARLKRSKVTDVDEVSVPVVIQDKEDKEVKEK